MKEAQKGCLWSEFNDYCTIRVCTLQPTESCIGCDVKSCVGNCFARIKEVVTKPVVPSAIS
jgi:hypothetical protein